jgi:hypothetical protein
VRAAAAVEKRMVRGMIYQRARERQFVCHGWKIVFKVGAVWGEVHDGSSWRPLIVFCGKILWLLVYMCNNDVITYLNLKNCLVVQMSTHTLLHTGQDEPVGQEELVFCTWCCGLYV